MLELFSRHISGVDGIDSVYSLCRRILLRHIKSHSCDRKLLFGIVFGCLCNSVLKLSCWLVSSNCGLFKLYGMS